MSAANHQAWKDRYVKSILDPSFCYTNSVSTDLKKTFERERARIKKEQTPPITPAEVQRVHRIFDARKGSK